MLKFFNAMFAADTPLNIKVTFIIAVAAFLMNLATWVSKLLNTMRRIYPSVILIDTHNQSHWVVRYPENAPALNIKFSVLFENKSNFQRSINRVTLYANGEFQCDLNNGFVGTNSSNIPATDGNPPYLKYLETPTFPLNIGAHTSTREYIAFSLPHWIDCDIIDRLYVYTSNGTVIVDDTGSIAYLRTLAKTASRDALSAWHLREYNLFAPALDAPDDTRN